MALSTRLSECRPVSIPWLDAEEADPGGWSGWQEIEVQLPEAPPEELGLTDLTADSLLSEDDEGTPPA